MKAVDALLFMQWLLPVMIGTGQIVNCLSNDNFGDYVRVYLREAIRIGTKRVKGNWWFWGGHAISLSANSTKYESLSTKRSKTELPVHPKAFAFVCENYETLLAESVVCVSTQYMF